MEYQKQKQDAKAHEFLLARCPDWSDQRGDFHLVVWRDLAQWMLLDGDSLSLIHQLDGEKTLSSIIDEWASHQNIKHHEASKEIFSVIDELQKRGIVAEGKLPPIPHWEDRLSIANLTLNITNRCNLQCPWCYNAEHQTSEMPIAPLMDAIAAGKSIIERECSLIILGGEPFIDFPRLKYCLERASNIFSGEILVSTNGVLVDDSIVAQLKSFTKLTVQVSLDSCHENRHDSDRGKGVFRRAKETIRRLVEAGMPCVISKVFSSQNHDDLEGFLDMAMELGVQEARFIPTRILGRAIAKPGLAPDLWLVFQQLHEILNRRPEFKPLLARDFFSILMQVCRFSNPRQNCGVGSRVIFIDADAKVYPCPNHLTPEYLCGDLNHESLPSIFHDSPVMRKIRNLYQVNNFKTCSQCSFKHWCAGDCRGETLAQTGDPLAPSPHCNELRQLIREIFWSIATGNPVIPNEVSTQIRC